MKCTHLEDSDVLADLGEISDLHIEHCADCRQHLHAYRQIAQWIAEGETTHSLPSNWNQRTLARISATPLQGHRRRSVLATTLGLASISLILIIGIYWAVRKDHHDERPALVIASATLRIQLIDEEGWRAAPQHLTESAQKGPLTAHPGQLLRAQASVGSARYFEIRIYRGSQGLLVRCPGVGAVECRKSESPWLSWKIPSIGVYQVILLTSQQPIASPRGSFDQDIAAVLSAGGRSIDMETIDVH